LSSFLKMTSLLSTRNNESTLQVNSTEGTLLQTETGANSADQKLVVKENSNIILLENTAKYRLVYVTKKGLVQIGKKRYSVEPLIGASYGSFFELRENKFVPLDCSRIPSHYTFRVDNANSDGWTRDDDDNINRNNKELIDDNSAQQLTSEQIMEMKQKGIEGEKIVQALVEGSVTFQKKTEFSQQKYLRKKKQKHLKYVEVLPVNSFNLATMYFTKYPSKIWYI